MDEAPSKTLIRFEVEPSFKRALRRAAIQRFTTMTGYLKIAAQEAWEKDGISIIDQRDSHGAR